MIGGVVNKEGGASEGEAGLELVKNIERIEEMRLGPADARAISDLLNVCFGDEFAQRSFYVQRHHVRFVQRFGDRIVGHLALSYRAIGINGAVTSVLGIGDVGVDPEMRKQGLAAALLDAALIEARAVEADFVLLFGVAKFYARAGFVPVKNPMVWLEHDGFSSKTVARRLSEHLMVYALGPKEWDQGAQIDLMGCLF